MKVGFIGAGHMGSSMIRGLLATQALAPDSIWAASPDARALEALQQQTGIQVTTDNAAVAALVDVLVLAVRPQQIAAIGDTLAEAIQQKKPIVLSVMAGITVARLTNLLGSQLAIVRAMPNRGATIGLSATALYSDSASDQQRQMAGQITDAFGVSVWVTHEAQLDVVTALSGSGPAYFFLMMKAMEEAAVALGLTAQQAAVLCRQTALGTATLAIEESSALTEQLASIAVSGGTTEQGLAALNNGGFSEVVASALQAAKQRSEALGKV